MFIAHAVVTLLAAYARPLESVNIAGVSCCSVLFCSVLRGPASPSCLFCSARFCSSLSCSVLFARPWPFLCCSVRFCFALFCLFRSVPFRSVLFCSVLCCAVLFRSRLCVCFDSTAHCDLGPVPCCTHVAFLLTFCQVTAQIECLEPDPQL